MLMLLFSEVLPSEIQVVGILCTTYSINLPLKFLTLTLELLFMISNKLRLSLAIRTF